jgi:hypothetical protein
MCNGVDRALVVDLCSLQIAKMQRGSCGGSTGKPKRRSTWKNIAQLPASLVPMCDDSTDMSSINIHHCCSPIAKIRCRYHGVAVVDMNRRASTALSGRKPIIGRFSVRSASSHRQNVHYLARLFHKRKLYTCLFQSR